jgi:hypothetical protein
MGEALRNPRNRFRFAVVVFVVSIIGWPATHALMVLTNPPENSWVFHVLLAISWFAITATSLDFMATTDVRKEQEEE